MLRFSALGQELGFTLHLDVVADGADGCAAGVGYDVWAFGAVVWSDGVRAVRSAVAVRPARAAVAVAVDVPPTVP